MVLLKKFGVPVEAGRKAQYNLPVVEPAMVFPLIVIASPLSLLSPSKAANANLASTDPDGIVLKPFIGKVNAGSPDLF